MLTIKNIHTLINERIVLSVIRIDMRGTYFVYNMSRWHENEAGNERYDIHLRHINKLHSDIQLVLNGHKTGKGYLLYNKERPKNSILLTAEQIQSKFTFLKAIEVVMTMY